MCTIFRKRDGQLPLRFRVVEKTRKTSAMNAFAKPVARIDEVAGVFGQDTLKWPRCWHRLLEIRPAELVLSLFPLRCLYHVSRLSVPSLALRIPRGVTLCHLN